MSSGSKAISRIVETYAQAIFDIAVQTQLASVVNADLDTLGKIFTEEKDLRDLTASPYFTSQQKADLLMRVFSQVMSDLTMNFLMVLVRHNRIKLLPEIRVCYDRIWENYKGYVPVKVTTSQRMDNDWIDKLADDISSAMNRKILLELSIDPSIIGGVVIRYADKVVDNTVRTRLLNLVRMITSAEKRWMKIDEIRL